MNTTDPLDTWENEGGFCAINESWYVYALVSETTGRTYIGIALDPEKRLLEHNGEAKGGAKATRGWRPWKIVKVHGPFSSRSEACKVEYKLKQKKGKERLE